VCVMAVLKSNFFELVISNVADGYFKGSIIYDEGVRWRCLFDESALHALRVPPQLMEWALRKEKKNIIIQKKMKYFYTN